MSNKLKTYDTRIQRQYKLANLHMFLRRRRNKVQK